MPADYIITGAVRPLGRHILEKLQARECRVVGIDQPELVRGAAGGYPLYAADVRDSAALRDIFRAEAREYTVVIHAAERMSLSDTPDRELFAVNYGGTKNILDACIQQSVRRLVYVGSALTLPERSDGRFIREGAPFDPAAVHDAYAKSKAAACAAVAECAGDELDCVIVLPTTQIGGGEGVYPLDRLLSALARRSVRFGVSGGIDIADVRDTAQGVVLAADKGMSGQSYILSGGYVTLRELFDLARSEGIPAPRRFIPYRAAKQLVKLGRAWDGEKPLFTERALALLHTGTHYSHDRATRELGYRPRAAREAITDAIKSQQQAAQTPDTPLCLPQAAVEAM